MTLKHLIVSSAAAMTVVLSGALFAQTAGDQAGAAAMAQDRADVATDTANGQPAPMARASGSKHSFSPEFLLRQ